MSTPTGRRNASVSPVPPLTQVAQVVASAGVRAIGALRWLTWVSGGVLVARAVAGTPWLPEVGWQWGLLGWLLLINPVGRVVLAAVAVGAGLWAAVTFTVRQALPANGSGATVAAPAPARGGGGTAGGGGTRDSGEGL